MALPRSAPPTTASASDVVSVNSSMLARVPGPADRSDTVTAYSTHTYTEVFRGGEMAQVIVSGDLDTDLDLYVYDQFGNLVASDDDESDQCVGSWIPAWTGRFTIRIVNRGSVYNDYRILTN